MRLWSVIPAVGGGNDVYSLDYHTDGAYRVSKMKFGKTNDANGKNVNDKTTVIYNE